MGNFKDAETKEEGRMERPLGITILAVLEMIGGVIGILGGVAMAVLSTMMANIIGRIGGLNQFERWFGASIGFIFLVVGVIVLVTGVLSVAVGWGFWNGSGWSWVLGIILCGIGIVMGISSLFAGNLTSLISILIGALIIYYLFTPDVKAWFGRT